MSSCGTAVISVSNCSSFGLIYASPKDTLETKKQILAHDKIYEELCVKKEEKNKDS